MLIALECTVLFVILSKYDNHQRDMLHRLCLLKELDLAPYLKSILDLFTTYEIVPLPFPSQETLVNALSHPRHAVATRDASDDSFFIDLLPTRVIEFNLRVVAKYYSRIRIQRLAELLKLSVVKLELHLSEVASFRFKVHFNCCRWLPRATYI